MDITVSVPRNRYRLAQSLTREQLAKELNISDREADKLKYLAKHGRKTVYSLQREGEVVGAFSCLHVPFEHPRFLDFIVENFEARGVTRPICLGDVVDLHSITYHESSPDGYSPGHELIKGREHLNPYVKAFPSLVILLGNHDRLPYRKATTNGIPREMIKTPQEIWKTPDEWTWTDEIWIDGVRYVHGDSMGHAFPLASSNGYSVVMGHWHGEGYVQYRDSGKKRIFGCAVGCGVDAASYAMEYGKSAKNKPLLGCAVIRGGVEAEFIPMPLELAKYRR